MRTALFVETTTIGLREHQVTKRELARTEVLVEVAGQPIRVEDGQPARSRRERPAGVRRRGRGSAHPRPSGQGRAGGRRGRRPRRPPRRTACGTE